MSARNTVSSSVPAGYRRFLAARVQAASDALDQARSRILLVRSRRHLTGDPILDLVRGPERYAVARSLLLVRLRRCREALADAKAFEASELAVRKPRRMV